MKYRKDRSFFFFFILVILFSFFSIGCMDKEEERAVSEKAQTPIKNQNLQEAAVYPSEQELAEWQANETGRVMILMYHVIGSSKESTWAQTTANFRRDLEMLYEQGYSLLSLKKFLDNNIDTPAGRTPVILTFDDSYSGHFRYLVEQDGTKKIDPECAVGVLLDFGKQQPLFGHTATFFVNNNPPFGQKEFWQEKLQELESLDFEIGNHTLTHPKLTKLNSVEVQKELAGLARLVEETVPGYKVDTLALPYGISPQNYDLAVAGVYEGFTYQHRAVLKVGANPALSPAVKGFDPLHLPRVRASSLELAFWLNYFQNNPDQKYISDGNPQTIAIPCEREELLDKSKLQDKKILTWSKDLSQLND
ncbi:MAG: polysaccharide deacetylase family protein [Peptococcia bacterium]|jgi:peptidoglycan/xylan/chitin deacetylase (PgdA/CDA1 family)